MSNYGGAGGRRSRQQGGQHQGAGQGRGGGYGGGGRGGGYENDLDFTRYTPYYEDDNTTLRREVFVDWASEIANTLGDSRTSLRRLYDHVSSMKQRIRSGGDAHKIVVEGMGRLSSYAKYQAGRGGVIRESTCAFLQQHSDYVYDDKDRFEGFYQLFQSVMAYLRR